MQMHQKLWIGMSLATVLVGLVLAAASNPRRFSLSPHADRTIDLLVLLGLGCTAVGIVSLLLAVRGNTQAMIAEKQREANLWIGLGFALQLIGILVLSFDAGSWVSLPLILSGVPLMAWGCMAYAEAKRYSKWFGLVGVLGLAGLLVLIALPVAEHDVVECPNSKE